MFTNKHVVTALLVAPVLAILAWFAVGKFAGEPPHAAVPGQVYPLLEKSNCRYASGRCELVNGDLTLALKVTTEDSARVLELRSSVNLQGVLLAVVPPGVDAGQAGPAPATMTGTDGDGAVWRLPLAQPLPEGGHLRLVAATADNRFTAEVATSFANEG